MESYGEIPGKGSSTADDKTANLQEGWVADGEHAGMAKQLVASMGYDPNVKVEMNQGGPPINISSHEYFLNEEQVAEAKARGFDLTQLSPDSEYNDKEGIMAAKKGGKINLYNMSFRTPSLQNQNNNQNGSNGQANYYHGGPHSPNRYGTPVTRGNRNIDFDETDAYDNPTGAVGPIGGTTGLTGAVGSTGGIGGTTGMTGGVPATGGANTNLVTGAVGPVGTGVSGSRGFTAAEVAAGKRNVPLNLVETDSETLGAKGFSAVTGKNTAEPEVEAEIKETEIKADGTEEIIEDEVSITEPFEDLKIDPLEAIEMDDTTILDPGKPEPTKQELWESDWKKRLGDSNYTKYLDKLSKGVNASGNAEIFTNAAMFLNNLTQRKSTYDLPGTINPHHLRRDYDLAKNVANTKNIQQVEGMKKALLETGQGHLLPGITANTQDAALKVEAMGEGMRNEDLKYNAARSFEATTKTAAMREQAKQFQGKVNYAESAAKGKAMSDNIKQMHTVNDARLKNNMYVDMLREGNKSAEDLLTYNNLDKDKIGRDSRYGYFSFTEFQKMDDEDRKNLINYYS